MKKNKFLFIFVFVCGTAVMFLEMAAARMLAPYFGNSIFVWGNIIGIVLIALSLGYYYGGKLADKYPEKKYLMFLVLMSGVYISIIPLIFKILVGDLIFPQYISSSYLALTIVGSFLTSMLFFAPPIFILGFVSPYAIRLATTDLKSSGKVAGSLYAFSTLGSIIGTFLSSFLIVPFWGSRETVYLSAFLLIFISVLGIKKKYYLFLLLLLPVVLYLFQYQQVIKDTPGLVHETDSHYQYIQVIDREDKRLLVTNEGIGVQSFYDRNNIITNSYFDYLNMAPYLTDNKQGQALIVGLAGGIISRQYNHFFPEIDVTGVEIDPGMIEVANEYFDLDEQNVKVVEADGRIYLNNTKEKFDYIILDAYSKRSSIPWHLTTQEFFQTIEEHLNENGVVTFNVVSIEEESDLITGFASTLKNVFEHVYFVPVETSANNIIIASNHEIDLASLDKVEEQELQDLAVHFQQNTTEFDDFNKNMVYTDNKAPAELVTESMWLKYIFKI